MKAALTIGLGSCCALLLVSCSFNARANHARGCEDCAPGQCVLGYCLQRASASAGTPGSTTGFAGSGTDLVAGSAGITGGSAGSGSTMTSTTGGAKSEPQKPTGPCKAGEACYLGPAGTSGVGSCRSGTSQCQGTTLETCMGQVLPSDETCNDLDDDCDGQVDEEVTLGSCSASGTGACGAGQLRCEAGQQSCVASGEPSPEVCNGIDDDCDGTVDNGSAAVPCYPAGDTGCTKNTDGSFSCKGVCKAGTQACMNGMLQACTGYVQPSMEICGGTQAADEDCDGQIDDGCPCSGNQTQPCYPGPLYQLLPGTACRAGVQHCTGGTFGACEGAVTAVPETCQNQGSDDDCNFTVDDIPNLNAGCTVSANKGLCRSGSYRCQSGSLTCVTPAPLPEETACDGLDEDCDGHTDEIYNLATDEKNCGRCGNACPSGNLCCGGSCHDPVSDAQHCGSCNHPCGSGNACCGGNCGPAPGTVCTISANHGVCRDGTDQCVNGVVACVTPAALPEETACDGLDEDCDGKSDENYDLANDVSNCGHCGNACPQGNLCCGGQCFDPSSDPTHCGSCTIACGNGTACCKGNCEPTGTQDRCMGCDPCPGGQACCGGQCTTTGTSDPGNCQQGQACCAGGCAPLGTNAHCLDCAACNSGDTCCGAAGCVNLQTDSNHCGTCEIACNQNAGCSCMNGMCQDSQGAACH